MVVLGPPGRPVGPLEVTEIRADSTKLTWAAPEDNGGDEILGYVVEKMNKRTGEWEKVRAVVTAREKSLESPLPKKTPIRGKFHRIYLLGGITGSYILLG